MRIIAETRNVNSIRLVTDKKKQTEPKETAFSCTSSPDIQHCINKKHIKISTI